MSESPAPRHSRFRITIANLLMLTLGIAIGFTPFKLWELHEPPQQQAVVQLQIVEVPRDALPDLMVGSTSSSDALQVPQAVTPLRSEQLRALQRSKKVKLLAAPTVMVMHERSAEFKMLSEVPFKSDQGVTGTIRESGLKVTITPTFLRNGRIQLSIASQVSELALQGPEARSRSLAAHVELADGETIVFGGFQQDPPQANPDSETLVVVKAERVRPAATARVPVAARRTPKPVSPLPK